MKLLGLDYGNKYIGLALADDETRIASPFKILENQGDDFVIEALKKICGEEGIEKIVIGLPLGLANQESRQFKTVADFIAKLKNNLNIPVETEDERLSTVSANNLIKEQKKRGERNDSVAAMVILQSYLDKKTTTRVVC